jgi:hypothetical protein
MKLHGLIWILLVATSILVIVAVVRGVRRHYSAIELLDGTFLGVVGLLTCVALLAPQLKVPAGVGISLFFLRFLWVTFQKHRRT